MRPRRQRRCLLALLLPLLGGACVSVARPGHYELPHISPPARPLTRLQAQFTGWRLPRHPQVARRLDRRFTEDLRRRRIFAQLRSAGSSTAAELVLAGEVHSIGQPLVVFSKAPLQSRSLPSFGYSGMQVLMLVGTVGLWPTTALFGVPTDWGKAHVRLGLTATDRESGVRLAGWGGDVTTRGYAGLYYWQSPLAKALRQATTELVQRLQADAPALDRRLRRARGWRRRHGLDRAADSAARAAALRRALTDQEPVVRGRALVALVAAPVREMALAHAVAALAHDRQRRVARLALEALAALDLVDSQVVQRLERPGRPLTPLAAQLLHRFHLRLLADELDSPELGRLVRQLARPDAEQRHLDALAALERLGPTAVAALPAVIRVLQGAATSEERVAACKTALAMGQHTLELETALTRLQRRGGKSGRAASFALQRLQAMVATSPAPTPPTAPAPPTAGRIVAVFAVQGSPASRRLRRDMSQLLAAHLTAEARFRVIPPEQLRRQLARRKRQSYRDCVDRSCQIELGRAVAANLALSSRIVRRGKGCALLATLYDLKTEATDDAAVIQCGCSDEELLQATRQVARKLARR